MAKKLKFGREMGEALTLGIELAAPTLLCAFLGYLADRRFGTFPLSMMIGLFLGAAAGFWNVAKKHLT